jgi:putative heme-binding domain-containing protein
MDTQWSDETRLASLLAAGPLTQVSSELFDYLVECLAEDHPVAIRLRAAEIVSSARLSLPQLYLLTDQAQHLGPMELGRILSAYSESTDDALGKRLVQTLEQAPSVGSIPVPTLRTHLEKFGEEVQREAERLYALLDADAESQREHFQRLLNSLEEGDVRRGQAVFYGSKAACSACHSIGYLGGKIGPDLTRIGGIRNRQDLLESIVFPSASFVRSYEPVVVVTVQGQVFSGNIQDEGAEQLVLVLSADQTITIPREDIEEIRPGKTSIMPAGLDKQLSPQELADLLAFLENSK